MELVAGAVGFFTARFYVSNVRGANFLTLNGGTNAVKVVRSCRSALIFRAGRGEEIALPKRAQV